MGSVTTPRADTNLIHQSLPYLRQHQRRNKNLRPERNMNACPTPSSHLLPLHDQNVLAMPNTSLTRSLERTVQFRYHPCQLHRLFSALGASEDYLGVGHIVLNLPRGPAYNNFIYAHHSHLPFLRRHNARHFYYTLENSELHTTNPERHLPILKQSLGWIMLERAFSGSHPVRAMRNL